MRIYKPKEIADEMLAGATTQETEFCLASDVAALRKAQKQFELRLLDEIELLAATLEWYADEIRYKGTSVHMCGHTTGQSVLHDGGKRAQKVLESRQ